MNYDEAKDTLIMEYFSNLLRIKSQRVNQQETLLSRDVFQFNQLSCLKVFCQINLIGTAINMGETEKDKSNTQWITGTVDYFYRFLEFDCIKIDV